MSPTGPTTTRRQHTRAAAVAADPEADQRAGEANAAVVLVACLSALVGGTHLLARVLGHFA